MKTAILCICILATAWALPDIPNNIPFKRLSVDPVLAIPSKDINARITNGKEAVPHSIPYQAYLVVSAAGIGGWLCGGSLISSKHVLTAAHCLADASVATVYLGVHNLQENETSRVTIQSEKLIPHADYSDTTFSNDIGIIVLEKEVAFNEYVSVATLPSRQVTSDYEGEKARVSGWGLVSGEGNTSDVLLEVNSTVISNEICKSVYEIVIDSQLCTLGDNGEGTCDGDSGGPLIAGNEQIGVVSYGARGCPEGYPSGYTRVTSYLDWIEDTTGLKF